MRTEFDSKPHQKPLSIPIWLGLCLFSLIALFFLWEEHKAHILGLLPYVLLLACPIIHLFMHRGHAGHHDHSEVNRQGPRRPGEGESS